MKDLDFDEIDRAVNSTNTGRLANTDSPKDTAQQPEPVIKPQDPSMSQPTLAGRRSSGQFMDVVHPSSNMRKPTMIVPERPTIQQSKDTQNIAKLAPVNEPGANSETPIQAEIPKDENRQSEPIEINELKKVATENESESNDAKSEEEDADIDKISQEITEELNGKSDEALDTPFIAGTKVEKRPLGAFSAEQSNPDEQIAPNNQVEKQTGVGEEETKETDIDKSIPEELQDKLLKIESNDVSTDIIQSNNKATFEKPAAEEKVELKPEPTPETKPVTAINNQPSKPIEATSINQQYKEQPSTGDQHSGPIYDTDAYHKALVHPPKKKSSWIWILWIFILIIAGAASGAALYYLVLPLL